MRCASCPVTSGECHGETGARPHFCGWAATGEPGKLMLIRDVSAGAPPPTPPPILTRAVNLAGAVASHFAAGLPKASEELKAARLAVCIGPPGGKPCDQRLPGGTCAGCGCNLSVKAGWAEQECPLGKWPG